MERRLVGREHVIGDIINKAKGDVCKELEKVCPTETSFKRMKKEMHDIFDALQNEITNVQR